MTARRRLRLVVVRRRPGGEMRFAEAVVRGMGSMTFIGWQTAFVVFWILLNVVALVRHFDPYPFILLNLLFSVQAAYAGPFILMASNRQEARDRYRDDREAEQVALTYKEINLLHQVNARQLEILEAVSRQLSAVSLSRMPDAPVKPETVDAEQLRADS